MRDEKGRFIKGNTSWMKGKVIDAEKYPNFGHHKPHSEEAKKRMSLSGKGKHSKEDNSNWENFTSIKYEAIHYWVRKKLGKASTCSFNPEHIAKCYDWANISGSYLREIDDYASLCRKCHIEYDAIRRGYFTGRGGPRPLYSLPNSLQ